MNASVPAATLAAEKCFHCSLPVSASGHISREVAGVRRDFCCAGCAAVCAAIHDAGLQAFYRQATAGDTLAPPPAASPDLAQYDLAEVQAEFVDGQGDVRAVHLLVEGIHCAACIWLIEHRLAQLPGVLAARVNLATRRLWLQWEARGVLLSTVLQQLALIGYRAVPYNPQLAEAGERRRDRALLLRMAFAGFAMMNLLWVSIALYGGADRGEYRQMFYWVGFTLATPTLFYSGWPFLRDAWRGVRNFYPTMDLPIAIGALATYLYSLYATLSPASQAAVYYDTVVNFLFVILVGRYLEAAVRRRALAAGQRLLDLQSRVAWVLHDGVAEMRPIRRVGRGDLVLVRPGDRVPVDGRVDDGRSSVDESLLSGESTPVSKARGDKVSAGTINIDGALTVRTEAILGQTSLGHIIDLVESAQSARAPIQCTSDRIVPWFVAVTLGLALLTLLGWLPQGLETALLAATTVLIVTCPCAFGLATPMAVAAAAGVAAQAGILLKNGGALETLTRVRHLLFDKTGTLTTGRMRVLHIETDGVVPGARLLALAAALEQGCSHPLAAAIVQQARAAGGVPAAAQVRQVPGGGVQGSVDGVEVCVGSRRWLRQCGVELAADPAVASWEAQGVGCVRVAVAGREAGFIVIGDQARADAGVALSRLRAAGMQLTLLSGDRWPVARALAQTLGGMDVHAEMLPQDKADYIAALQRGGACVAMVGDGVNDAPALSRADVSMVMAGGADIAAAGADIILLSERLDSIYLAQRLAQRTLRVIKQNIAIAVVYNAVMVPLAMAALITPLLAALAMPVSSLLVIGNAARLRRAVGEAQSREEK